MTLAVSKARIKNDATYQEATTDYLIGSAVSGYVSIEDAYDDATHFEFWAVGTADPSKYRYGVGIMDTGVLKEVELRGFSSSGFVDEDAVTVTIGPQPTTAVELLVLARAQSVSVPDDDLTALGSSDWVLLHDAYGLIDAGAFAMPVWVGAFQASVRVRWATDSNGTSRETRLQLDGFGGQVVTRTEAPGVVDQVIALPFRAHDVDSYPGVVSVSLYQDSGTALTADVELSILAVPGSLSFPS